MKQVYDNFPQHKIVKTLNIPLCTMHNYIGSFSFSIVTETGDIIINIYAHEGHGWKSKLDACDLQGLSGQYIKNRYDYVMEIIAWDQEHCQKSLSVNTFHFVRLKVYHAKKKPNVNMIQKCWHLLWVKTN